MVAGAGSNHKVKAAREILNVQQLWLDRFQ